jgi:hypothetical protein
MKNDKGELFQMSIQPFIVTFPPSALDDVRERFACTLGFEESFRFEEMT